MTGFLLTIAATAIQTSFRLVLSPQDFLTSPYARLTVRQTTDEPRVKALASHVMSELSDFVFYKIKPGIPSKEVCFRGPLFAPLITDGEPLSEEAIAAGRPVALASEKYYLTHLRGESRPTVSYGGERFAVTGVYSTVNPAESPIVDGYYYVNMNAPQSAEEAVEGEYYLGSPTLERDLRTITSFLDRSPGVSYTADIVNQNMASLFAEAIEQTPALYMALILTIILLVLHISTMTGLWCNGRMYEISVKMLCGATVPVIFLMLSRDYLVVFSLSYLAGWLAAALLLLTGFLPFVGAHIYLNSSLFAYLICLMIGMTIGCVALYRNVRRLDIGALN